MHLRRAILLPMFFLSGLLAGCAAHPVQQKSAVTDITPWSQGKIVNGRTFRSAHYAIHTTLESSRLAESLAELMESALRQYQQFAPATVARDAPLECYIFQYRPEWADFTADKTGDDAALYLLISRGGYTLRDWYVAYYIGDVGTYAVAAHEGWHQYVARNFKSRLPPFLEEGIATMFENVQFSLGEGKPPVFDLSPRTRRASKLKAAIDSRNTWPLAQLITMHAGDVVSLKVEKTEAFYAQSWAFAEFLWTAEGGKYRPALQRLLSDCAAGVAYGVTPAARRSPLESWNPATVQPMLEHYLDMSLPDIQRAYDAYCRRIVTEFIPRDMQG